MKYCMPQIHLISAAEANAVCVDGSIASPIVECTVGGNVTMRNCNVGAGANGKCVSGTAAPVQLSPTGSSVGVGCVNGNTG